MNKSSALFELAARGLYISTSQLIKFIWTLSDHTQKLKIRCQVLI